MGMYYTPENVADEILSKIDFDDSVEAAKEKILPIIEREMREEFNLGNEYLSLMVGDGLGIAFSFQAVVRYQKEYQEYLDDKPSIAREVIPFEEWFLGRIQEFKGHINNLVQ
jgi:hypothetical protein